MSLMGTLAKVAIGVVVAKGVGSMIQKAGAGASAGGSAGGTVGTSAGGGSFGGTYSPGGGLGDMMGEILGGKRPRGTAGAGRRDDGTVFGGSGGGIGDLLQELGARGRGTAAGAPEVTRTSGGGGLDDLLGGLGRSQGGGSGLGDLLGGLLGGLAGGAAAGGAAGRSGGAGGSFGDILNQSFGNRGEPDVAPTRDQDAAAGLMLRAMIQAAKSDGKIDAAEQQKLLDSLGEVSADEKRFVETELSAPIDVAGLARQVPQGLAPQVYTMSVMAIDLDNRNEAQYLHQFATALGLDQRQVNHIHARLGVPPLYA